MYFELSEIVNDLELKNFIKILHHLDFNSKSMSKSSELKNLFLYF